MINHAAEIWLALFAAFAVGSLLGWLVYRWIDRSDYAFDQRELSSALGRRIARGQEAAPELEAPAQPVALLEPPAPTSATPSPTLEPATPAERPSTKRFLTERPRPKNPLFKPRPPAEPDSQPETNAAETLRERVRASSLAASWRAARDRRADAEDEATALPEPQATKAEAASEPARLPRPASEPVKRLERPVPRPTPSRKPDPAEEWEPAAGAWPPAVSGGWPIAERPSLPQLADGRSSRGGSALVPLLAPPVKHDDIWSGPEVEEFKEADREIVEAASLLVEAPAKKPEPTTEPKAEARPEPKTEAKPQPKPVVEETRPPLLAAPPANPDNLRKIKGIGQAFEKKLNRLGVYHYRQIAEWTPSQQTWIGDFFGISGRIERDDWTGQAARLVAEAKDRDQPKD